MKEMKEEYIKEVSIHLFLYKTNVDLRKIILKKIIIIKTNEIFIYLQRLFFIFFLYNFVDIYLFCYLNEVVIKKH